MTDAPDAPDAPPIIAFPDQAAFASWLHHHHTDAAGIWLKLAKAGSAVDSVTYAEAVETALCYGWIDGQKQKFDDAFWLQRFTPRRPRSKWSRINRDKATELIERGDMQPSGLAEVERAQADGRWAAAYDSARTASVPDDLAAALEANPKAAAFFAALDGTNRYAFLYRVQDAKRPETRARRIEDFVAMLAEGRKLHG